MEFSKKIKKEINALQKQGKRNKKMSETQNVPRNIVKSKVCKLKVKGTLATQL